MKQMFKILNLVLICVMVSCNNSSSQNNRTTESKKGGPASNFHACNYDGSAYEGGDMSKMSATEEGEAVVEKILEFTGLPQNFKVQIGDVPNAAAIILQDPDGSYGRYILYNPEFMKLVDDRTKNNWAGISILAHEIGHHLSGHTLLPGGSQPAIELEADKFSGYVLYKMGANLQNAQVAMNTLVGDEDGETHPGRPKRLKAIMDGWLQACKQAKGACDVNTAQNANQNNENDIVLNNDQPEKTMETMTPNLPSPTSDEIPLKFDRFVYDEANFLTDEQEKELSDQLKAVAQSSGAEVVILCPKSLNGLSMPEYAGQMMEKMRIGKMDLANGAVLLACSEGIGYFVQPGIYWVLGPQMLQTQIDDMLAAADEAEGNEKAYQALRYAVSGVDVHLNTGVQKWRMDYPTLADAKKDGEASVRKITRAVGTVIGDTGNFVGDGIKRLKFKTDSGEEIFIHTMTAVHPNLPTNTRLAIVGRLFDMKYATVMEVLSVEAMR